MPYSPRFQEALAYAAEVHADQIRKGTTTPYIIHLLAVASLVGDHGGDEDQVIAALLHDAPEDQGGQARLEDIHRHFGANVASIVEECTDTFDTPKPPWRARKEAYVAKVATKSKAALLVTAADKLHNARTIVADLERHGESTLERFTGKKDGTLWYYRAMVKALEERGVGPIAAELRRTVEAMHRLAGDGESMVAR